MKVLSFNIRCADDANGHSKQERAPRIKAVVDACDPDLIGLQEVTDRWLGYIEADYLDKYAMYSLFRCSDPGKEAATILYKKDLFDLKECSTFWYSDTPDVPSKGWCSWGHYRVCSWALLTEKASGKDILFLNTHYGFSDKCQLDSTALVHKFLEEKKPERVIFTGDFNMTPQMPAYKLMTEKLKDANVLTANDQERTFHGYTPDKGDIIDYCFVDGKVTVNSSKVIRTTFDGKYPSDHYPVLTDITID